MPVVRTLGSTLSFLVLLIGIVLLTLFVPQLVLWLPESLLPST